MGVQIMVIKLDFNSVTGRFKLKYFFGWKSVRLEACPPGGAELESCPPGGLLLEGCPTGGT